MNDRAAFENIKLAGQVEKIAILEAENAQLRRLADINTAVKEELAYHRGWDDAIVWAGLQIPEPEENTHGRP